MAEVKGKLSNGFEYIIDDDAFNDMELVEDLAAAQGEDPLRLPKVFNRLLGEKQKIALYDSLRDESGKVPVDAVTDALYEMFENTGDDGKNS